MSRRTKAFELPAPDGWVPNVGDVCWLWVHDHTLLSMVGSARVVKLDGPYVLIRVLWGERYIRAPVGLEHLRPIVKRKPGPQPGWRERKAARQRKVEAYTQQFNETFPRLAKKPSDWTWRKSNG